MTTPLEFMERVLPWPGPEGSGWGNLHWSLHKGGTTDKDKRWRGEPFKTAEALITRAQKLAMAPPDKAEDIFYCTSIQSMTDTITMPDGRSFAAASRHADTATLIKAIFLDVDIKTPPKGYTSLKEALDAISKFCADAHLPGPSALVLSGGGVHVYWISGRPLTIAEWRPFAEGLKAEAMRLGLRADYGVTADPARILRVPGTFNRKIAGQPRPVKILGLGCDYDFAVDLAALGAIGAPLVTATVTKAAPFDLSAFAGKTMNPLLLAGLANATDKLSDGIDRYSDLPLDPTEVIKGCGHFRDALVNNGKGHGQGLWMLTVLASTWFENGYECAKTFSNGYPTYDEGELKAMWERKVEERAKGLGWPSCKSFENEGCKSCKTCPFRPLNKSPLNLAQRVKPPDPDPVQQVVTNPVTNVVLTADDLRLPRGFVLWNGLISMKVNKEEDPKKPPDFDYIPVFIGEVISKPQISNHRPPTLFFKYKQGPNYVEVVIPYTAYQSDQALANVFLEHGILTDTRSDKFVRSFMRSWVARIDLAVKRLTTAPLGWVVENGIPCGFAYGGKLYMSDGREEDSDLSGEFYQKYMPSGEEAPIHDALALVSQRNVPALEIATLQAWASPLVEISGLKSTAIMWIFSKDGGRGKSTSLRTGMALWGAPDRCRMKRGATFVGLENTFDKIRNLPGQVDELTEESAIDKIADIFQNIGEGGQGPKGTRNGGVRADKFWQLNLTCGSNTSLRQYQARKGQDTNAKATRVFEIKVEAQNASTTHSMTYVDQLIGSLEYNYGHLGLRYAKYLAMNHHAIKTRFNEIDAQVIADLKIVGNEERYWKTTVSLTLLAAELANAVCNKTYFHVDAIKAFMYDVYHEHRAWVAKHVHIAGSGMHTEEAWAKLLGAWINNQVVTDIMHTGGKGQIKGGIINVLQRPPADRGFSTYMHWCREPALLRIAYGQFVDDLTKLGMGTEMVDTFQKLYGGKVTRKVFLAGIPIPEAKPRINVWEIPIALGHPLYSVWADKVQAPEPANSMTELALAQDAGVETGITATVTPKADFTSALAAGAAQAAVDGATVRGAGR